MAVCWGICGTGRGVGKTHLARRLAAALPGALCAKLGHHPPKTDGPPNYFRSTEELAAFVDAHAPVCAHLIIESNAWVLAGRADIVVFLEGGHTERSARSDVSELRQRAQIRLGGGQSVRRWQPILRRHVRSRAQRQAVLDLLCEQVSHLGRYQPDVRSKTWLVVGDVRVFGGGIADLLRRVNATGSLRVAASGCGISYRHAWNLLQTAQRRLGSTLVHPRVGGVGGGGSTLTESGQRWLALYTRLDAEVADFADRRFSALFTQAGPA
jgi:molybdate transport system regulatory protein